MNRDRRPPWEFGRALAGLEISNLKADEKENTQRVLSGEFDDNLVTLFNSLSLQISELTCLSYYYENATERALLDGFSQAGLAIANMFRQVVAQTSSEAKFSWNGIERTVPGLPSPEHNSLLHSGKIVDGLPFAFIGGNREDVSFLSNLSQERHVNSFIREHPLATNFVSCLKALFRGDETKELAMRAGALARQVDDVLDDNTPEKRLLKDEYKMFLALAAKSPDKIVLRQITNCLSSHESIFDAHGGLASSLICRSAIAALTLLELQGVPHDVDHPYAPKAIVNAAVERHKASRG